MDIACGTTIGELSKMPTGTPNELMQHAVALYHAGLIRAASIIFLGLHKHNTSNQRLCHMLAQCGIMLRDVDMILRLDLRVLPAPTRALVSLVAHSALHTQMRDAALTAVQAARVGAAARPTHPGTASARGWVLVVPAGGTDFVAQLWCNLASLRECTRSSPPPERIVVAHAPGEWTQLRQAAFREEFGSTVEFVDLSRVVSTGGAIGLRGFQIKLAALAYALDAYAASVSTIVMSDADILWVQHPTLGVVRDTAGVPRDACGDAGIRVGVFRDLWHSINKRHEKSASTSFLRDVYGVCPVDGYELESGVVCVSTAVELRRGLSSDVPPRHSAALSAALWHLFRHSSYYFALAYGDKDLFDIASRLALNTSCHRLGRASMLGYIVGTDAATLGQGDSGVHLHSMLQYLQREGCTEFAEVSHVHSTLLPATESVLHEPAVPTHECFDTSKVAFVTQNGRGTISVPRSEMTPMSRTVTRIFDALVQEWLPAFRNAMTAASREG